jgi:hypothetical protein
VRGAAWRPLAGPAKGRQVEHLEACEAVRHARVVAVPQADDAVALLVVQKVEERAALGATAQFLPLHCPDDVGRLGSQYFNVCVLEESIKVVQAKCTTCFRRFAAAGLVQHGDSDFETFSPKPPEGNVSSISLNSLLFRGSAIESSEFEPIIELALLILKENVPFLFQNCDFGGVFDPSTLHEGLQLFIKSLKHLSQKIFYTMMKSQIGTPSILRPGVSRLLPHSLAGQVVSSVVA